METQGTDFPSMWISFDIPGICRMQDGGPFLFMTAPSYCFCRGTFPLRVYSEGFEWLRRSWSSVQIFRSDGAALIGASSVHGPLNKIKEATSVGSPSILFLASWILLAAPPCLGS